MFTTPLTQEEVQNIWNEAKESLKTQLTPAVFSTWIASNPLTKIEVDQNGGALATITCQSAFHATNLKKNLHTHLKTAITEKMSEKYSENKNLEIYFEVGLPTKTKAKKQPSVELKNPNQQTGQSTQKNSNPGFSDNLIKAELIPGSPNNESPTVDQLFSAHTLQASLEDRSKSTAQRIGLKADFTFKTFAVSTTNEMAHAASTAVSNNPGSSYNPLFLYGGVGVGKTHLMHAIAHNIIKKNPETKIIYSTGEEFTNQIVDAIRKKKAFDFKKKYRNAKILLIDDVQFIAGKNAVQEEFFHTFNALIGQNSQIILTSDRPPHEINLLEDRLRSRFEAGLMIDIQQPSFELRTAILLIKAQADNIDLPMELAQLIAAKVDSARRIEGIIKQLRSEVELKNREISEPLINSILHSTENLPRPDRLRVKPQEIIKTTANHFRVKQSAIKGKRRIKDLVNARHIAMFLLRTELKMPLEEIGRWFSGRDHTSVLHAIKKINKEIANETPMSRDISALKMSLKVLSK